MGQQQTMRATGGALRRMIMVLAVAALTAAMLVVMAVPAFAAKGGTFGSPQDDRMQETFPGEGAGHKPLTANPAEVAQDNNSANCSRHLFSEGHPAQCA